MSAFDLQDSLDRARQRLGSSSRRPRSDRGKCRLDPAVLECLRHEVSGQERPPFRHLRAGLAKRCAARGLPPPSRATLYKLLASLPCPRLVVRTLPPSVQSALHNLVPDSEVPAHQVAFQCFDRGDTAAISFAAGLPWLALYQARRMRGYRKKSRGLIEAVARVRRI